MSIGELLLNGATGGVLGTVLHLATDWVDTKNKIALMKAQTESAEKTEAWKAFTAAQNSAAPFAVPTNTWPWVSSLYTLVAAFKDVTRPGLTWGLMGVLIYVYATATPTVRETLTPELTFGSFTALMFWFGSRYTRK